MALMHTHIAVNAVKRSEDHPAHKCASEGSKQRHCRTCGNALTCCTLARALSLSVFTLMNLMGFLSHWLAILDRSGKMRLQPLHHVENQSANVRASCI